MRAVIYARYSSDKQSDRSIEDQVRLCRERIAADGHTVTDVYSDHAVSGATLLRPGIQAVMQDAARGRFDLVYAEALDRITRDQEDVARSCRACVVMARSTWASVASMRRKRRS